MKSIPEDVSMVDLHQWLGQGWFFYKEGETLVPAQLVDEMRISTIDDNCYHVQYSLTFPFWPVCGALNLDGYAIYLERLQRRQYRRTYNSRCLSLTIPRKWEVMKSPVASAVGISTLTPDDHEVIKAAFEPKYYTYTSAMRMMHTEGWVSVALNPYVIVSGGHEKCHVYYRRKLVGTIKDGCLTPIGAQDARIRRIIKFFEGRVRV